jgi:hypothetical protein
MQTRVVIGGKEVDRGKDSAGGRDGGGPSLDSDTGDGLPLVRGRHLDVSQLIGSGAGASHLPAVYTDDLVQTTEPLTDPLLARTAAVMDLRPGGLWGAVERALGIVMAGLRVEGG